MLKWQRDFPHFAVDHVLHVLVTNDPPIGSDRAVQVEPCCSRQRHLFCLQHAPIVTSVENPGILPQTCKRDPHRTLPWQTTPNGAGYNHRIWSWRSDVVAHIVASTERLVHLERQCSFAQSSGYVCRNASNYNFLTTLPFHLPWQVYAFSANN